MKIKGSPFFSKSILQHLRLPFSYLLFPIYLFALSQIDEIHIYNAVIIGISLHFFIYPGSNIYNSFMDQDKGSIGLLQSPPPVSKYHYYTSMLFDSTGLLLCTLIGWQVTTLMLVYVLISKAYSWRGTRIKRYPITGWLTVALFQGGYTYMIVYLCGKNDFNLLQIGRETGICMAISTLLIGGYYPLTQIYQHEEDFKRGDITISYKLGIKGTFLFAAILFVASCLLAYYYFGSYGDLKHFYIFLISIFPAIGYFTYWYLKVNSNLNNADYRHAMNMTLLSSTCLNFCFLYLLIDSLPVKRFIQAFSFIHFFNSG